MDYEKKYKEALERAKKGECLESIFPELKESKISKEIIKHLISFNNGCYKQPSEDTIDNWVAWLEKQGHEGKKWIYEDVYIKEKEQVFQDGIDEVLENPQKYGLEKQGEQKPLYIRFGDMPGNGKSKIYRGEEETGEEDGVSVYPAFEMDGNIVLGLTLPVTKTTLYTQQHLLEYDDRPCYLVSGDYVGKGADGEPLIRNVSVIKRLDNYRIKEPTNGLKIGDLITDGVLVGKIDEIHERGYHAHFGDHYADVPDADNWHKWTILDAKDGDVLAAHECLVLFKNIDGFNIKCYCTYHFLNNPRFYVDTLQNKNAFHPATKEQHELLFAKMKEAGYEWDADTKELKKIGQNHTDKVGPHFHVEKGKWYVCIRPFTLNGNIVVSKGRAYKSREDNAISGEDGRLFIDNHDGDASKYFRPWTIRDAKPGDAVYHRSPLTGVEYIVMFRGVNGYGSVDSYFRYNSDDGFGINIPSVFGAKSDITPATEEQRGLLFSKMKEAGYEWDADTKELKKIGQDHTGWSLPYGKKETAEKLIGLAECLEMDGDWMFDGLSGYDCGKLLRALAELIEANPAWGEEDEEMKNKITKTLATMGTPLNLERYYQMNLDEVKGWFKSLKDRVQP